MVVLARVAGAGLSRQATSAVESISPVIARLASTYSATLPLQLGGAPKSTIGGSRHSTRPSDASPGLPSAHVMTVQPERPTSLNPSLTASPLNSNDSKDRISSGLNLDAQARNIALGTMKITTEEDKLKKNAVSIGFSPEIDVSTLSPDKQFEFHCHQHEVDHLEYKKVALKQATKQWKLDKDKFLHDSDPANHLNTRYQKFGMGIDGIQMEWKGRHHAATQIAQ